MKISSTIKQLLCFRKNSLTGLLAIVTALFFSPPVISQVNVFTDSGEVVSIYENSYALVIGASQYEHDAWSDLPSIPEEIKTVKAVLEKHQFNVTILENPNRSEMKNGIEQFMTDYGYNEKNRLLLFYAGHAYTSSDGSQGYLVPVDAVEPESDDTPGTRFLQSILHMSQMVEWSSQIIAKHALFVFDTCFSGTIFETGRGRLAGKRNKPDPKFILSEANRSVRQFISSGTAGQEVPAKSIFTPMFVDALQYDDGDGNQDGFITGKELGVYLQQTVPEYADQNPQFGAHPTRYELTKGDFLFASLKREKQDASTPLLRKTNLLQETKQIDLTLADPVSTIETMEKPAESGPLDPGKKKRFDKVAWYSYQAALRYKHRPSFPFQNSLLATFSQKKDRYNRSGLGNMKLPWMSGPFVSSREVVRPRAKPEVRTVYFPLPTSVGMKPIPLSRGSPEAPGEPTDWLQTMSGYMQHKATHEQLISKPSLVIPLNRVPLTAAGKQALPVLAASR